MDDCASTNKNIVLIITSAASFIVPFTMSSLNVALPTIGKEFAMDAVILGWVTTIFTLSSVIFTLPIGKLADILGRKKLFIAGFIINIVAYFLCAFATSSAALILFRALQGFASSFIMATTLAIVTSVFPSKERGKALGTNMAMLYLGGCVGPFLGGAITHYLGWRSIFYFGATLSLLIVLSSLWQIRDEWADAKGEKFDIFGSVSFVLGLLLILYGLTIITTAKGLILILLGGLTLLLFIRWEARVANPVLDINIFRRNPPFVFSNLSVLIYYSSVMASLLLLSLYLQYCKGLSPQTAGLFLIVQPAMMALFSPISGRISDMVESHIVASIGMAISCFGLIILILLDESTPLAVFVAGSVFLGIGFGLFSTSNAKSVMGAIDNKLFGVASAARATMMGIGMMISMAIVLILFSIFIGDAQISPKYYPAFLKSFKTSFIICSALCFVGIFVQFSGKKFKKRLNKRLESTRL